MNISGWGNYPHIDADITDPRNEKDLRSILASSETKIARGCGRSYGDSALAKNVIDMTQFNLFRNWDECAGLLVCESGVTIEEIISCFLPRGWFVPVTPGTKFVTVGGAVASDVHGKNHHLGGSFSDHVQWLKIMIPTGEIINCSRVENSDLFRATCGGMGLTGVITEVAFTLIPVAGPYIEQKTIKAENLSEVLSLFEKYEKSTYTVAWVDCQSSGDKLGRSILYAGEHADRKGQLESRLKLNLPMNMPGFFLNKYSISVFNEIFYRRAKKGIAARELYYDPYFYPLDSINHWNRMYGKRGFLQYQFVIPKEAGELGLAEILRAIVDSRLGSFLAVLKVFGKGNDNYLSFPMEGYSLALDFKFCEEALVVMKQLDDIVLAYGGRVYLAKDARLSEEVFKKCYPKWNLVKSVREEYRLETINSNQSIRLGI